MARDAFTLRTGLLVVGAVIAIGCRGGSSTEPVQHVQLVHPNGLSVVVPGGMDARERAAGFAFTAGQATRAPWTVEVDLVDAEPMIDAAQERALEGGALVRFALSRYSGGSGGQEYRLRASKPAAARWIALTATVQAEHGEPSFDEAWAVLAAARLETKP